MLTRRARRHAALRGLRAVPVHAGGDEERDADAVRDRLPAGLRGGSGATFDRVQIQCVAASTARRAARGEVRFLQASGVRHQARRAPHRPPRGAGRGRVRLRRPARARASARARRRPHDDPRCDNDTAVPEGLDRAAALRHSLLSTHVVARVAGGRFVSPLEAAGLRAESTPGRCSPRRTTTRCSAPRSCSPTTRRSRPRASGSLFDSTEIEEALLIHVLALSDEEREAAAAQDPAVRQMLERAARDDAAGADGPARARDRSADPREGEPRGRGRRRDATGSATRSCCGRRANADAAGPPRRGPPGDDRAHLPRLRRHACTWRSPSTTSPARS